VGRVILDSSVVIASLKSSDIHYLSARNAILAEDHEYGMSAVTVAEVLVEYASSKFFEKVRDDLLNAIPNVYEMTTDIAVEAARIRSNRNLKLPDAIISATAIAADAELWTFDQKLAKAHKGAVLLV
jgi:predicted nucleic acid-binding protein